MLLKEKHKIENYEEKAKVLRENGWQTWYHNDNWIKTEWIEQGKKYDMMGRDTDDVYKKLKVMTEKDLDVYDIWEAPNGNLFIKISDSYSIAIGPKGGLEPTQEAGDFRRSQYVKSNDVVTVKKVGQLVFY